MAKLPARIGLSLFMWIFLKLADTVGLPNPVTMVLEVDSQPVQESLKTCPI